MTSSMTLKDDTTCNSPGDPNCNACSPYWNPNVVQLGFSILIVLGILLSYLPQHHRIISRRSSEGISPYFVLLGTTSGTSAFANIFLVRATLTTFDCCNSGDISEFECFAGVLGVVQISVQWACFAFILILFLLYFPRTGPVEDPITALSSTHPPYSVCIMVVALSVAHMILCLILSLIFIFLLPHSIQSLANVFGISSAVLSIIQYLPQLYTTFKLKRVGSLSIPMMCIQAPGSFVFAGSLVARLGADGWSTWGVYAITGALQGILLTMAVIFQMREQHKMEATTDREGPISIVDNEAEGEEDEATFLLVNER